MWTASVVRKLSHYNIDLEHITSKNMINNEKLMVFPHRKIEKINMIDDALAIPNLSCFESKVN